MLIISFANDSVFLSINCCALPAPPGFPPSLGVARGGRLFLTTPVLFATAPPVLDAPAAPAESVPAPAAFPAACDFTPLSHESYLLGFLNFVFMALTAFGFFNSSNTFL